ncbi:MAG: serpin family protein [Coleofasciculaceae cyanobacterium]
MNRPIISRVGTILVGGIFLVGLLGGFASEKMNALDHQANSQPPESSSSIAQSANQEVDSQLVEANTKFGFKLLQEILKSESENNVFISPSSVAIALAMTYNGASGETQQAMADALALQGMSLEEINQANKTLEASLENADPEVKLSIANSLWARQGIAFKPQFLERNQQFYGAEIAELDFGSSDATDVINNWVKDNTSGKIEKIIEQIKPEDVLFLINAIYFKGNWTQEFDPNQTTEQSFHLLDGSTKQQPMMSQSGEYQYYENENFQAVSLPYGNERLSFYVFLPREESSLADLQNQLNAENWQQWTRQFNQRDGLVKLPRFKFEYEIKLTEALKALGMETAFNANADFSEMTTANVKIDEVKHKTFIEVNEEGTEAAAVTSGRISLTSIEISEPPFQMVVDRPFFCAIRDNQTGSVLFMGSIVEPK